MSGYDLCQCGGRKQRRSKVCAPCAGYTPIDWDAVAEDVEFMLNTGEERDNIALRLGMRRIDVVASGLRKRGYVELARRLDKPDTGSGNEEWKRVSRNIETWLVEHETGPRDRIAS